MFNLCLRCGGLHDSHPASESGDLLWCGSRCPRPGYTAVATMADALTAQAAVRRDRCLDKSQPVRDFQRALRIDGFARTHGKDDTAAVSWYYREATYLAAVEARMEVPSWLDEDERAMRRDYDEFLAVAMAERPDRY